MFVLMQDAAEAVTSVDVQVGESVRVGDQFGQRCQWPGVRDALVRSVLVVEGLELAQRMQQVIARLDQEYMVGGGRRGRVVL